MKKEFLVGLITAAAATGAMAQSAAALEICSGGAAGNGVQVTGTAGTNFVIVNFTPKCSSKALTIWLAPDCEMPFSLAAREKLRRPTTSRLQLGERGWRDFAPRR